MAVDESIGALSSLASSNTPAGTDSIGPDLDNHIRDAKKNIRITAENSQGDTAPGGFKGRMYYATSASASNRHTMMVHDGTAFRSLYDVDLSAGNVSRFYAKKGSIPGEAVSGTLSGVSVLSSFHEGSASGTFRGFFTGSASGRFTGVVELEDGSSATPSQSYVTDPDTGSFLSATGAAVFVAGGVARFKYNATGQVFIGDISNANQDAAGLTINQGSSDHTQALVLKSTYDHGLGAVVMEDDSYASIGKNATGDGGLRLQGISSINTSFQTVAYALDSAINTSKTANQDGVTQLSGRAHDGLGNIANIPANGNIFSLRTRRAGTDVSVLFVDTEGDIFVDGSTSLTGFDDYNDVALLDGLRGSMMPYDLAAKQGLADWIEYARPVLEKHGIVTYNDDGRHFISYKGLSFLLIDSIRQMNQRLERVERGWSVGRIFRLLVGERS